MTRETEVFQDIQVRLEDFENLVVRHGLNVRVVRDESGVVIGDKRDVDCNSFPVSRASIHSGYCVMLMTSQPADVNQRDSAFDEKRGPE